MEKVLVKNLKMKPRSWDYLIKSMKLFKDRKAAGKLLAKHLNDYKHKKGVLVLGIPRGGVVIAKEVAKELKLPLDIIVTRKIGAPDQPELALGAVDPDGEVVWDSKLLADLGFKIDGLRENVEDEVEEIRRREKVYRAGKKSLEIKGKTVILIDDGIATGSTTLSAINYLKRHKVKKIILAVPVASYGTIEDIKRELGKFGEVVVLETPEYFQAVGQFYHDFLPVSDQEVIQSLTSHGR